VTYEALAVIDVDLPEGEIPCGKNWTETAIVTKVLDEKKGNKIF
jgi:hypothetical protein